MRGREVKEAEDVCHDLFSLGRSQEGRYIRLKEIMRGEKLLPCIL